jgi:hypothetical protein
MSVGQRPILTTSDRLEQPDQTAAIDQARPDELETPEHMNAVHSY